jgi:hypothetical protein
VCAQLQKNLTLSCIEGAWVTLNRCIESVSIIVVNLQHHPPGRKFGS